MPKRPDLTDESNNALVTGLSDAKKELFNLRFQRATGQLENSARMGQVRKQIARFNTEIRNRQIAAAEAAERARVGTPTVGAGAPARAEGES
jgi:large subunit ribosomal protein L29